MRLHLFWKSTGADLYAVKELLGHSTLAMTERYSHLSNGTLQKAVNTLDRSLTKSEAPIIITSKGLESRHGKQKT